MKIEAVKTEKALLIKASGRLDASWSDYFTDTFLDYIRNGEHYLVIDAGELTFLSSAGIRSLVRISKELNRVKGLLRLIQANDFVTSTLRMTGFGEWLADVAPEDLMVVSDDTNDKSDDTDVFVLKKDARIVVEVVSAWKPWQQVKEKEVVLHEFQADSFALGIGSPYDKLAGKEALYGDFVTFCGHVVYQMPEDRSRPDYLIPVADFVPTLQTIQCMHGRGEMSHLWRFAPEAEKERQGVSELASRALAMTNTEQAAFVVLAETEGLVGAYMIQSPGAEQAFKPNDFVEMRQWLSFCGEPAYTGEQALVFGIVSRRDSPDNSGLLVPLASNPDLAMHAHAVIFPYQPLQNGVLDLKNQIAKFFNGPPPKGVMHLLDDDRPTLGLGESLFTRGAMWCAPVQWKEETV